MIHCLSNIEKKRAGERERERERAVSHQQLLNPLTAAAAAALFPGLLDESLLIRRNHAAKQWHEPNSLCQLLVHLMHNLQCQGKIISLNKLSGSYPPYCVIFHVMQALPQRSIHHFQSEALQSSSLCIWIITVGSTKFLKHIFLWSVLVCLFFRGPQGLKGNFGMMFSKGAHLHPTHIFLQNPSLQ